ncbi:hypothetical protein FD48_GL000877 [Lactiplantibacillus paraplantarum DSM 10667]|nr:hypothetical protein FD48_GL000877 [Lactiplantibacillus paraplantarum DSM 10667]
MTLVLASAVTEFVITMAPVILKASMPKIINLLIFFTMDTPPKLNIVFMGH